MQIVRYLFGWLGLILLFLEEIFLWMGRLNKGDIPSPMWVYTCLSSEGLARTNGRGRVELPPLLIQYAYFLLLLDINISGSWAVTLRLGFTSLTSLTSLTLRPVFDLELNLQPGDSS